jgi:hypothetical protein
MTLRVRQAGTADAAVISALNADVQALHAAGFPERFKPPNAQTFPPADVAEILKQPGMLAFIADIDSAPAGYRLCARRRTTPASRCSRSMSGPSTATHARSSPATAFPPTSSGSGAGRA